MLCVFNFNVLLIWFLVESNVALWSVFIIIYILIRCYTSEIHQMKKPMIKRRKDSRINCQVWSKKMLGFC